MENVLEIFVRGITKGDKD